MVFQILFQNRVYNIWRLRKMEAWIKTHRSCNLFLTNFDINFILPQHFIHCKKYNLFIEQYLCSHQQNSKHQRQSWVKWLVNKLKLTGPVVSSRGQMCAKYLEKCRLLSFMKGFNYELVRLLCEKHLHFRWGIPRDFRDRSRGRTRTFEFMITGMIQFVRAEWCWLQFFNTRLSLLPVVVLINGTR